MSIIKKGKIKSKLEVITYTYSCEKCGEIRHEKDILEPSKLCHKCKDGKMVLVSMSSADDKE